MKSQSIILFVLIFFTFNAFANHCQSPAPEVTKTKILKASSVLPNEYSSAVITINNKQIEVTKNSDIDLKKGLNHLRLTFKNGCTSEAIILSSPSLFFRPYPEQNNLEELRFTRLIEDPLGVSGEAPAASDLADQLRETNSLKDPEITLGQAFFAQLVDHDLTSNSQFQNGPSSDPNKPLNLSTPDFDLDNIYGFGPNVEGVVYRKDKLRFNLTAKGYDVPRSESGFALIADKRDDITGLTLQFHVLFKKYHNYLIKKYLRSIAPKNLSKRQKKWLFEHVRNQVIAQYQSIVVTELSRALTGSDLSLVGDPIENLPVEFSAAAYRIGHSLIPDLVQVSNDGNMLSPISTELRGKGRIVIPWPLLLGENAQKAARFDNQISPVMQELFIPLSPDHPELNDFVGGSAQNIGTGRVVDGVLRLDISETNILRAREQGLPSGEEVLAKINNQEFTNNNNTTDLWVYILNEAVSGNKYGTVGSYILQKTFAGLLNADRYSITSRKYTRKQKKKYRKLRLDIIAKRAY